MIFNFSLEQTEGDKTEKLPVLFLSWTVLESPRVLQRQVQNLEITFPSKFKCSAWIKVFLLLKPDSDWNRAVRPSVLDADRTAKAISEQAVE